MNDCIFCKIIKNEIPSYKLYEDDTVFAFLDIHPVAKGHTLVIPKKHYENIFDTPDDILGHISSVYKKLGAKIKKNLQASAVNIFNASGKDAQQTVFHLHFHIIPRFPNDKKNLGFHGITNDTIDLVAIHRTLT